MFILPLHFSIFSNSPFLPHQFPNKERVRHTNRIRIDRLRRPVIYLLFHHRFIIYSQDTQNPYETSIFPLLHDCFSSESDSLKYTRKTWTRVLTGRELERLFWFWIVIMAKKRKSLATSLDEVDRTMYSTFCSAANSLSQLYSQALSHQKLSFLSGERHGLVFIISEFISNCMMICVVILSSDLLNPSFLKFHLCDFHFLSVCVC